MKHVVIDYDVGNLASLSAGLTRAGLESLITSDHQIIQDAPSLILPGVGAFKAAMDALNDKGLVPLIEAHVAKGKPLLGICLGMQLLYETSYEYGEHAGLGFIKGEIVPLKKPLKVPHMGWNTLKFHQQSPLLDRLEEGDHVYFVHSYAAQSDFSEVIAYAPYGIKVPALVHQGRVYGMQFHPEKSARVGETLLQNYGRVVDDYYAGD